MRICVALSFLSSAASLPFQNRLKSFLEDVKAWYDLKSYSDYGIKVRQDYLQSDLADFKNIAPVVLAMGDLAAKRLSEYDAISEDSLKSTNEAASLLADFSEKFFLHKEKLRRVKESPWVPFINFDQTPKIDVNPSNPNWIFEARPIKDTPLKTSYLDMFHSNEEIWRETVACAKQLQSAADYAGEIL